MKTTCLFLVLAISSAALAQSARANAASNHASQVLTEGRSAKHSRSSQTFKQRNEVGLGRDTVKSITQSRAEGSADSRGAAAHYGTANYALRSAHSIPAQPSSNLRHRSFNPPIIGGPTDSAAGRSVGISGSAIRRRP
jgi:hypothetical protein